MATWKTRFGIEKLVDYVDEPHSALVLQHARALLNDYGLQITATAQLRVWLHSASCQPPDKYHLFDDRMVAIQSKYTALICGPTVINNGGAGAKPSMLSDARPNSKEQGNCAPGHALAAESISARPPEFKNSKEFVLETLPLRARMEVSRGPLPPPRKAWGNACLLYTSPSPRDGLLSRMPSSA